MFFLYIIWDYIYVIFGKKHSVCTPYAIVILYAIVCIIAMRLYIYIYIILYEIIYVFFVLFFVLYEIIYIVFDKKT